MLTTLHDLLYPPLKGFSQIKIDLPKPPRACKDDLEIARVRSGFAREIKNVT